jgi:hypothetical protein
MRQDCVRELLDVVRQHVAAPAQACERLARTHQRQRAAWTGAVVQCRVLARRTHQVRYVLAQCVGYPDALARVTQRRMAQLPESRKVVTETLLCRYIVGR